MKSISNIIEPNRLLLSWQALDSENRSRFIVAELIRDGDSIELRYLFENKDFKDAVSLGFTGHPAFPLKKGEPFRNDVLEAFLRRLPPRNRSDFNKYLEIRGISPDAKISDFALLGYTGAKLPFDGFEIVHPFENIETSFEFICEIAGFRHESKIPAEDIIIGKGVNFIKEPENPKDSKAIRIEYDKIKLGYVDRGRIPTITHYMDRQCNIGAEIFRKNGSQERPLIYLKVSIDGSSRYS